MMYNYIMFFVGMVIQICAAEYMAYKDMIRITPIQQFTAGFFFMFLATVQVLVVHITPSLMLGMASQALLAALFGYLGAPLDPIIFGRSGNPRRRLFPKVTITITQRTPVVPNPPEEHHACSNPTCIGYNKPVSRDVRFCIECGGAIAATGKTTLLK